MNPHTLAGNGDYSEVTVGGKNVGPVQTNPGKSENVYAKTAFSDTENDTF